jgi:hypothetical protein
VGTGADTQFTAVLLENNRGWGFVVSGDAILRATDITVRDTLDVVGDGEAGAGFFANGAVQVEIERALFDRNRLRGIWAWPDATVNATDVVVRGTRAEGTRFGNCGVESNMGAELRLRRARIEGNESIGVVAMVDATLGLTDVIIANGVPHQSGDYEGHWGAGLYVAESSTANVTRARIESNHEVSLYCLNPDTEVMLNDVAVIDTLGSACAETTCPESMAGFGVISAQGCRVEMERFLVTGSELCGVLVAYGWTEDGQSIEPAGSMDLHEGEVSNNLLGACIMADDYDLSRLMDRVIWRDNEANLSSTELQLPSLELPFDLGGDG